MGFRPCFNRNVYCDLTFKYIEIERYALINFVKELSQSKNHLYADSYFFRVLIIKVKRGLVFEFATIIRSNEHTEHTPSSSTSEKNPRKTDSNYN